MRLEQREASRSAVQPGRPAMPPSIEPHRVSGEGGTVLLSFMRFGECVSGTIGCEKLPVPASLRTTAQRQRSVEVARLDVTPFGPIAGSHMGTPPQRVLSP